MSDVVHRHVMAVGRHPGARHERARQGESLRSPGIPLPPIVGLARR